MERHYIRWLVPEPRQQIKVTHYRLTDILNWKNTDISGIYIARRKKKDVYRTYILFSRRTERQLFNDLMTTDGYSVSVHFSRKKMEPLTLAKTLRVDDWDTSEIREFFRPCAVDPGVGTLITAAYGFGTLEHEVRTFTNKEYYSVSGSKQRNIRRNREKVATGISVIESKMPSARTVNETTYSEYVVYFFENWVSLRYFYAFRCAKDSFSNHQGRQRATDEVANILINGGKKYDKKRRKKHGPKTKKKGIVPKKSITISKSKLVLFSCKLNHSADTPVLDRQDQRSSQQPIWRKSKVEVDNQGKMPFIVFGNGCISQTMAFKRHLAAPSKKIYNTLKRRERLGHAVVCLIDEYYTSQVNISSDVLPY
jgi:hypothetical protein